jgi:hypothetical protein
MPTLVVSAAESRAWRSAMSTSSISAASVLNAAQSPLLSLGQAKHRKHHSMTSPETQNAGAQNPPAAGQPGSLVNVTA